MPAAAFLTALPLLVAGPLWAQTTPPASVHGTMHGAPGAAAETPAPVPGSVGVMVMAHGGDEAWNASVTAAVGTLGERFPVALAFGMATPRTMAAALDSLRGQGVENVAVVRMFLSGHSFRQQTDYLLGLSPTPPENFVIMDHGAPADGDGHGGHEGHGTHSPADPLPIAHGMSVATHDDGLLGSSEAVEIAVDRALELSIDPGRESVLYLAHGMGDDGRNQEVLDALDQVAGHPALAPFAAVQVATLREDWPEKRAVAEAEIRSFVQAQADAGRRVLVVPARLSGFGPYAEVLEGLDYAPGRGLLPHGAVAGWMEARAVQVLCDNGWQRDGDVCPAT